MCLISPIRSSADGHSGNCAVLTNVTALHWTRHADDFPALCFLFLTSRVALLAQMVALSPDCQGNLHTAFHADWAYLHPFRQCLRVLFSHPPSVRYFMPFWYSDFSQNAGIHYGFDFTDNWWYGTFLVHLSAGCFFWEMSGLSPLHLEVSRYSLAVKIYYLHHGQNLLSTERNDKLHPNGQGPTCCLFSIVYSANDFEIFMCGWKQSELQSFWWVKSVERFIPVATAMFTLSHVTFSCFCV